MAAWATVSSVGRRRQTKIKSRDRQGEVEKKKGERAFSFIFLNGVLGSWASWAGNLVKKETDNEKEMEQASSDGLGLSRPSLGYFENNTMGRRERPSGPEPSLG